MPVELNPDVCFELDKPKLNFLGDWPSFKAVHVSHTPTESWGT